MNPQRVYDEEPSESTRPKLGVVQGGGETSAPQGSLQSVPATADESGTPNGARLSALEGGGETTPRDTGHLKAVDSDALQNGEQRAADTDAGGLYNPGGKTGKRASLLSKLSPNSKVKKRVFIAGGLAGGSAIVGIIAFFALLPLKIEHIVNNFEGRYSASAQKALGEETGNLLSDYVKSSILPSLRNGACHSTIEPGCVVTSGGSGPVGRLFKAWDQNRVHYKLATKFGLVLGKDPGGYYMNFNKENIGNRQQMLRLLNDPNFSMWDLDGTARVSRGEFKKQVKSASKEMTLWDKLYFRHLVNKTRKITFHERLCSLVCEKGKDSLKGSVLAGKLLLVQRTGGVIGESNSLLMQCMLTPEQCSTKLEVSTNPNGERQSKFSAKLNESLNAYISANGPAELAKLLEKGTDISKLGVSGYIFKQISVKITEKLGGDVAGALAGRALDKFIPFAGWISLINGLKQFARDIVPTMKTLLYAKNAQSAAVTAGVFASAAAELKSGNVNLAELGSVSDQLGTTSKYYRYTVNGDASALGSSNKADVCPDTGQIMAAKDLVCPEQVFSNDGSVVNFAAQVEANPGVKFALYATDIPGLDFLTSKFDAALGWFGSTLAAPITSTCQALPVCSSALTKLQALGATFFKWVLSAFPSWTNHITPNSTTDAVGGGFDALENKACQQNLGCARISDQTAIAAQNEQLNQAKIAFQRQSMFARVFDANTQYSLVSRMAMAMPGSLTTAANSGMASLFSNPFAKTSGLLSNIFSTNHAFAVSTLGADPFGVIQYGYPTADIPEHPQTYWDANCASRYNEQTGVLDNSAWLNSAAENQSENTGEGVSKNTNPCMLILGTVQSAGGLFDSKLITDTYSSIPSALTTGTPTTPAPTTGTSLVGADGFPGGSCVVYVQYILKRHVTGYTGASVPLGKDMANIISQQFGYVKNNTPAIHAVVSFPAGKPFTSQSAGHVALVAGINADGSILVEEANWSNTNAYGTHTVPANLVPQLTYAHVEGSWH